MSEGFRISRSYIEIGSAIELVKLSVGNRAQLEHHVGDSYIPDQTGRGLRSVCSRILASCELAGQQELHRAAATITQKGQGTDQRFEVAIVVVMTDEKQLQRALRSLQLVLHVGGKRRGIARKFLTVKPVIDNANANANFIVVDLGDSAPGSQTCLPSNSGAHPVPKLGGEGLAGRYGYAGPGNRPLGESRSQAGIDPQAVFLSLEQVPIEIGRCIEGIPGEQDLRHRRSSECEVPRREQDVRAATPDETGKG